MRTIAIAYLGTAVVFFAMDFVWLSTAVGLLYKPCLDGLLLETPHLPRTTGPARYGAARCSAWSPTAPTA